MSLVLAAARKSFATRVSTLTSPPTRAPCDPSEVTTCVPSDAYVLGVTRLPFGACSASTSLIFRCPDQIAKLAAHAWKGQFWVELANAASLRDPRVPEPLLQSWSTTPDPSARTSRRPALFQLSHLAHGSPILRSVFPLAAARRPTARGSILQRQSSHQPLKRLKGPTNAKVERQSDQNANFENIGDHFQNSIS